MLLAAEVYVTSHFPLTHMAWLRVAYHAVMAVLLLQTLPERPAKVVERKE